jgi:hypothetical protein
VTNANNVRLCFDNDAKSAALAARNPRHGNGSQNFPMKSFTLAIRELGWRAVGWPPTVIECHKWGFHSITTPPRTPLLALIAAWIETSSGSLTPTD